MSDKKPSFIVIGLALFSMFFGSGNLIFPLMLGRDAGSSFLISAFGFVLSAVLIPCAGVLAIVLAEGDYLRIFSATVRGSFAKAFIFFILLSFVPFGAGPRCVVLAHASLKTFLPMPSLFIFASIFLAIVAFLVADRNHLVDILGKVLTPLLIICVAIMVIFAFINGEIDPPLMSDVDLFKNSLLEGYNTQDLLSSLFFSSSLIMLLKSRFKNSHEMIVETLKGSLVGVVLLSVLYVFLIACGSLHNDILIGKSGIDLVSILAKHILGPQFGLVAAVAVALACLTTAVALVMAMSDFLRANILQKGHGSLALPITVVSICFTSLLEFDGIMAIISPTMKFVYPLILFVVIRFLFELYRKKKQSSAS